MAKKREHFLKLTFIAGTGLFLFIFLNYDRFRQTKIQALKQLKGFYYYDNELEHLFTRRNHAILVFKNCTKNQPDSRRKSPRILCTVFTHKKNFNTKAVAVNATWGYACDTLLFVTSDEYASIESKPNFDYAFLANFKEDYSKLTIKTIKTILYVYAHYQNAYDWMLKADDDTFMIIKNLKKFLKDKCVDEAHTYGLTLGSGNISFNSGGAGYVLNAQTVNAFVHKYYTDRTFCKHELVGSEDLDVGYCLGQMGVLPGNSSDKNGMELFHSHSYEISKHEAKSKNHVIHFSGFLFKLS
jgi:glycoprotein-N-acetylgalactosamine 3-beta-galactosyltransferase